MSTKGNKKLGNDCGHNKNEWGSKDDSEEIEWDQYYHNKNKWRLDETENEESDL